MPDETGLPDLADLDLALADQFLRFLASCQSQFQLFIAMALASWDGKATCPHCGKNLNQTPEGGSHA